MAFNNSRAWPISSNSESIEVPELEPSYGTCLSASWWQSPCDCDLGGVIQAQWESVGSCFRLYVPRTRTTCCKYGTASPRAALYYYSSNRGGRQAYHVRLCSPIHAPIVIFLKHIAPGRKCLRIHWKTLIPFGEGSRRFPSVSPVDTPVKIAVDIRGRSCCLPIQW